MTMSILTIEMVDSDHGNGCRTYAVTTPWAQVSADYDDIVEEHSKARIAGFRAGKAPRSVVEKRFERGIIDELSRRCGWRFGREALKQAGVDSLGPVEVVDIECGRERPFRFTLRFFPMPDIALPDLDLLAAADAGGDPRDGISQKLLEQVTFDVPEALIRAELSPGVGNAVDHQDEEWKAASDRVRLMVILKRIARQEGIEVDERDVERRIEEKAIEFGASPAALTAELEKGGGRQRLREMLLAESTLNFLTERSMQ